MFSTECARLAERHPDLAAAAQRVIAQLQEMRTAEAVKVDDLASFLEIEPNQVSAVLAELAATGFLRAEAMVECVHCGVAALRSDYDQAYEDDGEYRCTCCDRPLGGRTIEAVTTYRRGEKWPDISGGPEAAGLQDASSPSIPPPVALDEQTFYTPDRLAEFFNINKDALRKRLERHRKHSLDGWRENEGRRPREAKYSYRLKNVRPILSELQASSERPAK